MNQERIGKFIRELRKEKEMSQKDLAEKLYISRQAVSNWENGLNIPDASTFTLLGELFNISTDELLLGKRVTKKERSSKMSDLVLSMVDSENKKDKIIRRFKYTFIIFTAIFLILFLGYYFINNYNSIKVYIISGESENFYTKDGIFVITNNNIYFRLGNLGFIKNKNLEINKVVLFYKKESEEKLIYSGDGYNILLRDYSGYEAFFKNDDLNYIYDNLYLRIYYNDTSEDIKLNFEKDFSNNFLSFIKKKKSSSVSTEATNHDGSEKGKQFVINFSKEKMNCSDENCTLEVQNEKSVISFFYFNDTNMLFVSNKNDKMTKEWYYYIEENTIEYIVSDTDNNELDKKIITLSEKNNYTLEEEKFIEEFNYNYIQKFLH